MLSKPLLKKTIKDNCKLWLVFTIFLTSMLIILILAASSFMNDLAFNSEGGSHISTNLILEQYYTMFAMMLPMVYIIRTSNKLIVAQVDKGSLTCVMSRPITRNQFSLSQAFFLVGSIVAMFSIITIVGIAIIFVTGVEIAIGTFLLLNLAAVCFHLAISGICYLCSCIFNISSKSLIFSAGIPILFFVFKMLSSFSGLAEIMGTFKYLTINTLFNFADIIAYSTNLIWQLPILFGIGFGCYIAGVIYFKKKDLPL